MLVSVAPTLDPATRLPVVVIDTTKLNGQLPGQHIVLKGLKRLPETDFCVVLFASHSPKPTLSWLQSTKSLLDRSVRKRVQRVYLVHETWLYKTIQKTVGSMFSPKFVKKLIYIKNLSQLAQHLDITLINITRDVYLHDLELSDTLVVPKHSQPVYGFPLTIDFIDQLLDFLYVAPITAKSFESTGGSPLVWILMQAFDRNQTVDLAEYGPQMVVAALKLYLYELPRPLLGIDVPLPIEGDRYLAKLTKNSDSPDAVARLGKWFRHVVTVYHVDSRVIAQSFGAAMFKLTKPTKDQLRIAERIAEMYCQEDLDLESHTLTHEVTPAHTLVGTPSTPCTPRTPPIVEPSAYPQTHVSPPRKRAPARSDLKPAKPVVKPERILKQKPSMRNIKGARVGELALKYENI